MEGLFVLDSKNDAVVGGKAKGEKMVKDFVGSAGRKRLADISNLPRRPTQDDKSPSSSATIKEYTEQLQKEKAALRQENVALRKENVALRKEIAALMLLADRNRNIEVRGTEVEKLRVSLQKMQQQNLQLAQSHSQMLAELNFGKDRLKSLQLELGCAKGLVIAKKLELEGKAKTETRRTNDNTKQKVDEHEETAVCVVADKENDKHCNTGRRQRSKSLGPSAKKNQDSDVVDSKRLRTRRQSARFKHDEPKPTEDFFETDCVDIPPCPLIEDKMQQDDSDPGHSSVKKEDGEGDSLRDHKPQEHGRSSLSRPSRHAAKKVQSYKEVNLNVKLRRPE